MVSLRSQLVALAAALAIPAVSGQDLEDFITKQRPLSLTNVLNNLGAAAGAAPGLVIASPSKTDPPYYYTWTRDSALTFKMLIDEFIHDPVANANLEKHIRDYLRAQAILQTVANPSGALLPSGRGLGEAKYEVDGSRFNGAWGRPQRDGPPLRAVALITWANWLAGSGDEGEEEARDIVWPVIANDLAYTGQLSTAL
ncbi:Glucoamylase P like protein [Verticillium longisporum]|uniref:Glucoamylase P like protein n=1 Tax=Verticillium longisporum TaxID=100787 RepID=A0A8I2ZJ35_VERLO|nr:Glucoamylase P like protein [Verticillium longisporum]